MIQRAAITHDETGDRIIGAFADHLSLTANFAPGNSSEPVTVGANSVITGGVVYARDLSTIPDIQETDRAVIRGKPFSIEGEVGVWKRHAGWAIQFAVKRVVG